MPLAVALAFQLAFSALAIAGAATQRRAWLVVGKPLATAALMVVATGDRGPSWIVLVGIACALVGDVALLFEGSRAFAIGLGMTLLAHVAYAVVFVGATAAAPAPTSLAFVAAVLVFTAALLARVVPRVPASLRGAVVVYGVAIATMATTAHLTVGGPWPRAAQLAAAAGATAFLVSDAVLAWNRFVRPLPQGQAATLTLYWSGQLGIALAARWAT